MGHDKRPGKIEAHIRVNLSLLDSPAFIALDWTARALFLDLRHRMRGTNNGNISAALSELRHRGWNSSATLVKALRQLEAVGLLRKTGRPSAWCVVPKCATCTDSQILRSMNVQSWASLL